ncbi:hypothetical protein [Halorussus halophilus]|uniref:hypothetical protein n=1 Tax=Halorussus halophilus TaxID=2650975 RepID=UPI0013019A23|nr:hypothetical protein [Halorussus halophilus]
MTERDVPWGLLGIGGVASLCCLGSAAAVGGASLAGGAIAGGLGASLVQILVTVLTVGVVGAIWKRRS